jgi:hypothetical protein
MDREARLQKVLKHLLTRRLEPSGWSQVKRYLAQLEAALKARDCEAVGSWQRRLESVGRKLGAVAPGRPQQKPADSLPTGHAHAAPIPREIEAVINRMLPSLLELETGKRQPDRK